MRELLWGPHFEKEAHPEAHLGESCFGPSDARVKAFLSGQSAHSETSKGLATVQV